MRYDFSKSDKKERKGRQRKLCRFLFSIEYCVMRKRNSISESKTRWGIALRRRRANDIQSKKCKETASVGGVAAMC